LKRAQGGGILAQAFLDHGKKLAGRHYAGGYKTDSRFLDAHAQSDAFIVCFKMRFIDICVSKLLLGYLKNSNDIAFFNRGNRESRLFPELIVSPLNIAFIGILAKPIALHISVLAKLAKECSEAFVEGRFRLITPVDIALIPDFSFIKPSPVCKAIFATEYAFASNFSPCLPELYDFFV